MATKPIARIGDAVSGVCFAHGSTRGWNGVIGSGSSTFTCDGIGVARVGDVGVTDCGHYFKITAGSSVCSNAGIPVSRKDDGVTVYSDAARTVFCGVGTIQAGSSVGSSE